MGNGAALRRQCSRPSSTLQTGTSSAKCTEVVRGNPDGLVDCDVEMCLRHTRRDSERDRGERIASAGYQLSRLCSRARNENSGHAFWLTLMAGSLYALPATIGIS